MSSDEVSEYENDSLIKEKRMMKHGIDIITHKKAINTGTAQYGLSTCIYQCIVISLLFIILFVMIGSIVWFYLSVYLQSVSISSVPSSVTRIAALTGLRRLVDFGISLSSLPNNTVQAIYDYDDQLGITQDQTDILLAIFNLFDIDGDNKWSLEEFKLFIDGAIQPEINFDKIDLDHDGVVSMKEIYLMIQAFDVTDIYECDETENILYNIFNYVQNVDNSNRYLFYEYIAQLWLYQLDKEKIGVFSKENYVKYIDEEEWIYHNHDNDEDVEFEEFRDSFFGSIYYQSWKKSMQFLVNDRVTVSNIYYQLNATDDATISALKLSTTAHEFDASIDEYIKNNNNNNQHDPSVSLLYSFPNLYFAQNLIHESTRRRLSESDCNTPADCEEKYSWLGTEDEEDRIYYCVETGRCIWPSWGGAGPGGCLDDAGCAKYDYYHYDDYYCIRYNQCEWGVPSAAINPTNCLSERGKVDILVDNIVENKELKDVKVGEYVFDGTKYSKVIAVEGGGIELEMIKLYINDTFIMLTDDHLLYDYNDNLIRAGDLKIGDKIYNDFVIDNIEYNLYETPSTPITMSGMIEVNGMKASCYIYSSVFADWAHNICLAPFRFLSQYVSEYYAAIIIEKTISDVVESYNTIWGPIWNETNQDLLFVFDVHPICNLIIVCLAIPIFYGKYMFMYILSFIM